MSEPNKTSDSLSLRSTPHESDAPDWELCENGTCYLVADGLETYSHTVKGVFEDLLNYFRENLKYPGFKEQSRGFSYAGSGQDYRAKHTEKVSLEPEKLYELTKDYITDKDVRVTYITFSLAGLIFTHGIDIALKKGIGRASVEKLILIQPGFGLDLKLLSPDERKKVEESKVVQDFLHSKSEQLKTEILDAIRAIRAAGKPIIMLYWPEDTFIWYEPKFLDELKAAGVKVRKLKLTAVSASSRANHNAVARNPHTCKVLARFL